MRSGRRHHQIEYLKCPDVHAVKAHGDECITDRQRDTSTHDANPREILPRVRLRTMGWSGTLRPWRDPSGQKQLMARVDPNHGDMYWISIPQSPCAAGLPRSPAHACCQPSTYISDFNFQILDIFIPVLV